MIEVPVGIDPERLVPWLTERIDRLRAPLTFDLVAGGHSCLTYVVTAADGHRVVLRRPPLGHVLATAHDVVREHRIIHALRDTNVPVPETLAVCEDDAVNGAPFFVMAHVDGRVMHEATDVDDIAPTPHARRRVTDSLVDALVALHAVDPDEVGLGDLSRREGYLERQLKRWARQWVSSKTRDLPDMERLHVWLVEHQPAEVDARIVHGDFRLGNLLVMPDATVGAVLDWELCTLGQPMADLAYLLRSWVGPDESAGPHLVPPTAAGGFPDRDAVVARYRQATGRDVEHLEYWMAFNAWRSAAIAEGVLRRYLDGNMGERPDDLQGFVRSVEQSAASGLEWAARA